MFVLQYFDWSNLLQVIKRNVDNYKRGKLIPKFHLNATYSDTTCRGESIPSLDYQADLIGAKKPYNTFTINKRPASGV